MKSALLIFAFIIPLLSGCTLGGAGELSRAHSLYRNHDYDGAQIAVEAYFDKYQAILYADRTSRNSAENLRDKLTVIQERLSAKPASPSSVLADRIRTKSDNIDRIVWHHHMWEGDTLGLPQLSSSTGIELYIGKRVRGSLWLRLRVIYHGESWLFAESFTVAADERRFNRTAVFDRDHSTSVWEVYDESVNTQDINMLQAIIESNVAHIRFRGLNGSYDYPINEFDRLMLQDMLTAFEVLGGTVEN